MFSFFRKIRKRLLSDNRSSKYLLYAIGEIALVVIGILIALQVNNWDQNRKSGNKETAAIHELHQEYAQISEKITQIRFDFQQAIEANIVLSHLCEKEELTIPNEVVDSLFNVSFNHYAIKFSQPVFNEFINSELYTNLSDKALKAKLYEWQVQLDQLEITSEILTDWVMNKITPYMVDNVPMKNWDVVMGHERFPNRSRLKTDYQQLFNSLAFENLIQNRLYFLYAHITHFDNIDQRLEEILLMTKSEN